MLFGVAAGGVSVTMLNDQRTTAAKAAAPAAGTCGQNLDLAPIMADASNNGRADHAFDAHKIPIATWALAVWEAWLQTEVLEQLIDALHEQAQYVRKLAAMTAEGRMSARILGSIPPMFLGMVYLVGPDYVENLFKPGAGIAVFSVALTLYFSGLFWLNSMMSTKG